MKYLAFLLLLIPNAFAGSTLGDVTISTTLTMLSPTALISGTGVGATISMTNGYFKNISATQLGAATSIISGTNGGLAKAVAFIGGFGTCTITNNILNVASCQHPATGQYGVSFTTPMAGVNYVPQLTTCNNAGASLKPTLDYQTASPTTAGFRIRIENSATGAGNDTGCIMVSVFNN